MSFARAATLLYPPTLEDVHPMIRRKGADVLKVVVAIHSQHRPVDEARLSEKLGLGKDFVVRTIEAAARVEFTRTRRDAEGRSFGLRVVPVAEMGGVVVTESQLRIDGRVVRDANLERTGTRAGTWRNIGAMEEVHLQAVRLAVAGDRSLHCDIDGRGNLPRTINASVVEILRRTGEIPALCFKDFAEELLPLRRDPLAFVRAAAGMDSSASVVEPEAAPVFG